MNATSYLLDTLNTAQREAVTAPPEHLLVLAGAGSGKTKVLTHRVAWLLETEQTHPYHILAVTFTNKAAKEMHSRISTLLNTSMSTLWIGTFHGIAHRLLRIHWQDARLPEFFQILDSDDQLRTIKNLLKVLEIDDKIWNPAKVQSFINTCKDQGLRAQDISVSEEDPWLLKMVSFYNAYEEHCQRTGLVDFAELLLRSYEMLRTHQKLLEHYQQRFHHILVDEFQDTNTIQYEWIHLLAGSQTKIVVVGDEDQSIYSWRGAKVENIQNFLKDFPSVRLLRLEQNYRSTKVILEAANALIMHNVNRLGKNLWTQSSTGEPIYLYQAYNETEEAHFVAEKISTWSGSRQDIAILYRITAQSRAFEEALMKKGIPYRIYGGLRFYERAEVKDVLAYLRLMIHRDDDGAFERIINTPRRGIGERTLEAIRLLARQQQCSLWQATQHFITAHKKTKIIQALQMFLGQIDSLTQEISLLPLHKQIERVKITLGLIEHYQKEGQEEAQRRLENLEELEVAAREFEGSHTEEKVWGDLQTFLAHAVLESGELRSPEEESVQLMTLHAAKGLEFSLVFLCGLEEDIFPHPTSIAENHLEEERRLCYVGMTRARRCLYLCRSESRYHHGTRKPTRPSRFIREIPRELIEEIHSNKSFPRYSFPKKFYRF